MIKAAFLSDDSKQWLNIFALKVLSLFKLKTNNLKNEDSLNSKSNHEKYNYKNPNDCYWLFNVWLRLHTFWVLLKCSSYLKTVLQCLFLTTCMHLIKEL